MSKNDQHQGILIFRMSDLKSRKIINMIENAPKSCPGGSFLSHFESFICFRHFKSDNLSILCWSVTSLRVRSLFSIQVSLPYNSMLVSTALNRRSLSFSWCHLSRSSFQGIWTNHHCEYLSSRCLPGRMMEPQWSEISWTGYEKACIWVTPADLRHMADHT